MSDAAPETTNTAEGQGGNASGETPAADEFKPINSQQELNAALKDRLDRERAKFKDYNDLKSKAAKLDQIEQANLSELEKANGRITTAEKDRDTAKAESLRLRIAVTHGISLEDADLFLTGTDEETLTAQAKRLADRTAEMANAETERKKKHPNVPKEGTSTQTGTTTNEDDLAFARGFFGGGS
jgi:ubiquitin